MKIIERKNILRFPEGFYVPSQGDGTREKGFLEINQGYEYTVPQFIKKYPEFDFEIVDETYGYNKSVFSGYLYDKNRTLECRVELYHMGAMNYVIDSGEDYKALSHEGFC